MDKLIVPLSANDLRRQLLANPEQDLESGLQLDEGQTQAAFTNATEVVHRISAINTPHGSNGYFLRRNMLDGNLAVASAAAIRLGRYAQAESLARRWFALPVSQQSEADPQLDPSRARSTLAHAIAMQGRNDEAQRILQPALAYYRQAQQAGAHDTRFRGDYAYALYVGAIASPPDAAGRAQRKTDLELAAKLIAGASAEAQKLADMRYVSGLIASADASTHL